MNLTTYDICNIVNGEIISKGDNVKINEAQIDNRKIGNADIFFAIKGERFNANTVVLDAFNSGASICIIDELCVDITDIPKDKTLIKVDNTILALGKIAKEYVKNLKTKIVAVTGSVGKTSTRDMVTAALSSGYNVFKTKGNFNSDIGLPLMLLSLNDTYDIAVLEMGMDHKGDIEYLVNIVNPDVAVITNIGISHIQNLGSQEAIFNAKMEICSLFDRDNTLVVNADDNFLKNVSTTQYNVVKVGEDKNNDICYKNITLDEMSSSFTVVTSNEEIDVNLNSPGKHNIINAMLSIAVADKLGLDIKNVLPFLNKIDKTSMRLDFIKGERFNIINDCYNASPDSMKAAIDVVSNMKANRRVCILGTMNELGDESVSGHRNVAEFAKAKDIDIVLATGRYTDQFKAVLGDKCILFENKEDLIKNLRDLIKNDDLVLVKASRGLKFETIVDGLLKI